MIVDSILSVISSILGWVLDKIPSIDTSSMNIADSLQYLVDLTLSMNVLLPIKEALIYAGIILALKMALLLFWGAMRLINLVRGAG